MVGDGCFQMTLQELAVIAVHRVPVKIALLNNEYLGMVRQQQQVQYKGNLVEVDLAGAPDYIKLAQAYGIPAWRVTEASQLDDAIGAAMAYPGPGDHRVPRRAHRRRLPVGARRHVARRRLARYAVRSHRRERVLASAPGPSCEGRERPMSKHTLVATVEEGPVVLNRVLSLFRQRSFAIESLSIGRTNEPGIMRLTMVVDGARSAVEQVTKQLYKVDRGAQGQRPDRRRRALERELALIKVSCKAAPQRAEVMQIADIYRARIVDVASTSLMVEVTGPTVKVDSLIELFRPYGVKELVRTGVVAMSRGQAAPRTEKTDRLKLVS